MILSNFLTKLSTSIAKIRKTNMAAQSSVIGGRPELSYDETFSIILVSHK